DELYYGSLTVLHSFPTRRSSDLEVLNSLLTMVQKGIKFTERDVLYAIELSKENKIHLFETLFETTITKNSRGQTIRAKTLGQKDYVQAMRNNDLVFGIGPAGT